MNAHRGSRVNRCSGSGGRSRGDSSHTVSIETGDFYINAPGARTNTDIGKEVGAALHGAAGQQWAAALGAFNSGVV